MKRLMLAAVAVSMMAAAPRPAEAKDESPTAALASVYNGIADSILAAKKSEDAIVRAILQAEREHALALLDKAAAPGGTSADVRAAAAHIGDFATEGGATVEPIRSRLLAGGHHHHADDTGANATYDEGYVVLTKKLKQEALELAKRCAKAADAPKPDAKEVAAIREALVSLSSRALAVK